MPCHQHCKWCKLIDASFIVYFQLTQLQLGNTVSATPVHLFLNERAERGVAPVFSVSQSGIAV